MFFISGFSAIFYQIAWQRLLFESFGVDIESVTIIVSAFMAGLGLGALFGGEIADRYPTRLIFYFCILELIIGLYGLISYELFKISGDFFVSSSKLTVAMINFILVFIPTTAMGATLPILIIFIANKVKNVGNATGTLYAINTLGASLGCIISGFIIFNFLDLKQAILLAACLNFFVSAFVYLKLHKKNYF